MGHPARRRMDGPDCFMAYDLRALGHYRREAGKWLEPGQ